MLRMYPWLAILACALCACSDDGVSSTEPEEYGPPGPPQIATVELPGGTSMEFVWIAEGSFYMGSPLDEEGRFSDESPRVRITLSRGFFMGRYEVTQEQWETVMGTRPWTGKDYVTDEPARPAVYISWDDAQELVTALNVESAQRRYRLPTEAEWEYVCRARTTTPWSFGDDSYDLDEYAWYRANAWDDSLWSAQPVGLLKANPWGLFDMHGNVQEWVQDWHGSYASNQRVDPTGPADGLARVVRGGAVDDKSRYTRSAYRSGTSPDATGYFLGVRLVMEQ